MLKTAQIDSTETSSLSVQLYKLSENQGSTWHVMIRKALDMEDLNQLQGFINQQKPFPFSKLSLYVDRSLLNNEKFLEILNLLNNTKLEGLTFIFKEEEILGAHQEISDALSARIAPKVFYPLQIRQLGKEGVMPSSLALQDFEMQVIRNIQSRKKEDVPSNEPTLNIQARKFEENDPLGKKIRLKELIQKNALANVNIDQYMHLEVQYVEAIQEQIVQQQVLQQQVDVETHSIQEYDGPLIGFEDFSKPYYKNKVTQRTRNEDHTQSLYTLLEKECHANLPHAIKYFSPAAAEHLAMHLPEFCTLNKENLPQGFVLKRTREEELILDYDLYLENEPSNPFVPEETEFECEPIYDIAFYEEKEIPRWLNDTCESDMLEKYFGFPEKINKDRLSRLTNMWIKHEDEGLYSFFKRLVDATLTKDGLLGFILKNYLDYFPQWEHFYNNSSFFEALEKMRGYSQEKRNCLKKFLVGTGYSWHDLSQTVVAFDKFWDEFNALCMQQNVSVDEINNSGWSTPKGGSPVVYMERMLWILKNSNNFEHQLKLLDGICLDNYGAYYASRYEDFKTVSKEMFLSYERESQKVGKEHTREFNKNFKLYRTELEQIIAMYEYVIFCRWSYREKDKLWLIDCSQKLPSPLNLDQLKNLSLAVPFNEKKFKDFKAPYQLYLREHDGSLKLVSSVEPSQSMWDFTAYCLRFMATQTSGISIHSFLEQFDAYCSKYTDKRDDFSEELLACILFSAHERFIENHPLDSFYDFMSKFHHDINGKPINHCMFIKHLILLLAKLFKRDIKLNQVEGAEIFRSVNGMNEHDYSLYKINEGEFFSKLCSYLEKNKYAVFKVLEVRNQKSSSSKWPMLYALDTANYLEKNADIAQTYPDDLLLFSELINRGNGLCTYSDAVAADPGWVYNQEIINNMVQVEHYLQKAATLDKPNNFHHLVQLVLDAENEFSFKNFITACKKIEELDSFDDSEVRHIMSWNGLFCPNGKKSQKIFTKDHTDLKQMMVHLIIKLETIGSKEAAESDIAALVLLSNAQLQLRLDDVWQKYGTSLSVTEQTYFLKEVKELTMKGIFEQRGSTSALLEIFAEKIQSLKDFQKCEHFAKLNRMADEARKLSDLFKKILNNCFVIEFEKEWVALFSDIDFSAFDYSTLFSIFTLLTEMPQRNYLSWLKLIFADKAFIANKTNILRLFDLLSVLNNHYLPSAYFGTFCRLIMVQPNADFDPLITKVVAVFNKDNKDPLLDLLMTHSELTHKQILSILNLSEGIEKRRDKSCEFLLHLIHAKSLATFLAVIAEGDIQKQQKILEILARAHKEKHAPQYEKLAALLHHLPDEELDLLYAFYETTPARADCLLKALEKSDKPADFKTFLEEFETAPFGVRDLEQQFSTTEVERVINESQDLLNGSIHTYQYRKQLMESFLFVNEIGKDLPVYHNKAAKDLTNAEIKAFFSLLKTKQIKGLTPFQNRLLALGLMREVMYRSTGEFPYSTQIIALIDGMMHAGDFIAGINTGQGKSLIDSMKAALLWIESERVEFTTSSLVDSKRDIEKYGSFFKLLGIPCSEKPIHSASQIEDFQKDGINFSTFSQLSLFYAKAKVAGIELDTADTMMSLVINESDEAILDDNVIYRYATEDGSGVGYGQEWIYYAINEFVTNPEFFKNSTSIAYDDVSALKDHLRAKEKDLKKTSKLVDKFTEEQYLMWIESSLTVNYLLKQNQHYVIPDELEQKKINGKDVCSKVTKILMKNDKVSPDSTFGNGIQQLLYARLNKESQSNNFVIEPENKTIISTNNKNFLDHYQSHKGIIWGSTGTPGSQSEMQEQERKYGFEFSKTQPHHQNKVTFNSAVFFEDENAQFTHLINQLTIKNTEKAAAPSLVFCKNIDAAERLFAEFEKQKPAGFSVQIYTGLGKEEDYINKAAQPGMITIVTSVFGRNTDIPYDKTQGLRVWHTSPDSDRATNQKNGRTGRQDSIGEVNFIYNKQDLKGKTIAEIQAEIDKLAADQRLVMEELYTLLYCFQVWVGELSQAQFAQGKIDFLLRKWSSFSDEVEDKFRESRHEANYDQITFRKKALAGFNRMMQTALNAPMVEMSFSSLEEALKKEYPKKQAYTPYTENVKLKNCTPPVEIAYRLLQRTSEGKLESQTKDKIKKELAALFNQINADNFTEENKRYLHYLAKNPTTEKVIIDTHKEFLDEYLQKNAQKLSFAQRWFGFESKLNQIISKQASLSMFHALAQMSDGPMVKLDVMKQAVNALLDEYLQTSWFINDERKTCAIKLKEQIQQTMDVEKLIICLAKVQIEMADKDIQKNKNYFLKPRHLFGNSRFQSTLAKALNLATALSGQTLADGVINPLKQWMKDATSTEIILDTFKQQTEAVNKTIDKYNACVILEMFENTAHIQSRKSPSGMLGRHSLFAKKKTMIENSGPMIVPLIN